VATFADGQGVVGRKRGAIGGWRRALVPSRTSRQRRTQLVVQGSTTRAPKTSGCRSITSALVDHTAVRSSWAHCYRYRFVPPRRGSDLRPKVLQGAVSAMRERLSALARQSEAPSCSAPSCWRRRFPWQFALFLVPCFSVDISTALVSDPWDCLLDWVRRSVGTASATTSGGRTLGCGPILGSPTRCFCPRTTGRSRTLPDGRDGARTVS
jgi:hypothetical protein